MQSVQQKLEAVENSIRRWHTRLSRASNAIRTLDSKRRRLIKQLRPHTSPAPIPVPTIVETKPFDAEDAFSIPVELKVTADVEAMRAERRAKEAAEKKAMPLSGKAALKRIKSK